MCNPAPEVYDIFDCVNPTELLSLAEGVKGGVWQWLWANLSARSDHPPPPGSSSTASPALGARQQLAELTQIETTLEAMTDDSEWP